MKIRKLIYPVIYSVVCLQVVLSLIIMELYTRKDTILSCQDNGAWTLIYPSNTKEIQEHWQDIVEFYRGHGDGCADLEIVLEEITH